MVISVIAVFSLSIMMFGCAGKEFAPKDPYPYWYYPKELPQADRAVEAARQAGKDKECPQEFKEAEDLKNKAYEVYVACMDQEAIDLANKATNKANALCPPKPEAKPEVKPEVKPETKPAPMSAPQAEQKEVSLENVHFDFDKATLTSEAREILDKNIQLLKENPELKVTIEGHACQHGPAKYNMRLSERRAEAVKEYLVKGGIQTDRLSTIAYGKTRPLYEQKPTPRNKNSWQMKANRRVHFDITK